jgi:hypothetical protein
MFKSYIHDFQYLFSWSIDQPCCWCSNGSNILTRDAYLPSTWAGDCTAPIHSASTGDSPFYGISCSPISCWTFSLSTCNVICPALAEWAGNYWIETSSVIIVDFIIVNITGAHFSLISLNNMFSNLNHDNNLYTSLLKKIYIYFRL